MAYIIAEIGSNWNNFDDCYKSIALSKQCGADAVKFQLFSHKELYGFDGEIKGSLPREWIPKLKEKADACAIDFMCSAFSPDGFKFINNYVNTHKLASSEITCLQTLETLKSFNKPIIASTGGHSLSDISNMINILGKEKLAILYCVSEYPSRSVDPAKIVDLKQKLGITLGFSDHSTSFTFIPRLACKLFGAEIIEKHVSFIDTLTQDSPHSLISEEFMIMCNQIKNDYLPRYEGLTSNEKDMVLKHNRRLIAIKDISKNERLILNENYGSFRSRNTDTVGASSLVYKMLDGKISNKDIKAFSGISILDVK